MDTATTTADTGPAGPTADTGPSCVPRAIPDPTGGPPILTLSPMAPVAPMLEDYDYFQHVFIVDSIVGYAWRAGIPDNVSGAAWWDHNLLPATTGGHALIPGSAYDFGDLDGDGVDDLLVAGVPADSEDDSVEGFIIPGPVGAVPPPVIDQPDALPSAPWVSVPNGGFASLIPHCGDLNGDGIEERCTTMQLEFGPYDGSGPDWQREHQAPDEDGFSADLDGDGVQELYISYDDSLERFVFTPDGPSPAVFNGIGGLYWGMDLDSDGVDEIYTRSPSGLVRITDSGFLANTIEPSPLAGRHPDTLHSGDFDGNGATEVLTSELGGAVFIYDTDGTQLLEIRPDGSDADFGDFIDVGDADGNGIDDIVFGTSDGWTYYLPNPLDCLP